MRGMVAFILGNEIFSLSFLQGFLAGLNGFLDWGVFVAKRNIVLKLLFK